MSFRYWLHCCSIAQKKEGRFEHIIQIHLEVLQLGNCMISGHVQAFKNWDKMTTDDKMPMFSMFDSLCLKKRTTEGFEGGLPGLESASQTFPDSTCHLLIQTQKYRLTGWQLHQINCSWYLNIVWCCDRWICAHLMSRFAKPSNWKPANGVMSTSWRAQIDVACIDEVSMGISGLSLRDRNFNAMFFEKGLSAFRDCKQIFYKFPTFLLRRWMCFDFISFLCISWQVPFM